jgi:hypothetical protein
MGADWTAPLAPAFMFQLQTEGGVLGGAAHLYDSQSIMHKLRL